MPAGCWLSIWSYLGVSSLKGRPESQPSNLLIVVIGYGMTWTQMSAAPEKNAPFLGLHSGSGVGVRCQRSNHVSCLPTLNPFFSALGCPPPTEPHPLPTQEKQILRQGTSFPKSPSLTCSISLDLRGPLFSCLGVSGPASRGWGFQSVMIMMSLTTVSQEGGLGV